MKGNGTGIGVGGACMWMSSIYGVVSRFLPCRHRISKFKTDLKDGIASPHYT